MMFLAMDLFIEKKYVIYIQMRAQIFAGRHSDVVSKLLLSVFFSKFGTKPTDLDLLLQDEM